MRTDKGLWEWVCTEKKETYSEELEAFTIYITSDLQMVGFHFEPVFFLSVFLSLFLSLFGNYVLSTYLFETCSGPKLPPGRNPINKTNSLEWIYNTSGRKHF